MSVTSGGKPESFIAFFIRRVRRDMQFSAIFTVDLVATLGYVAATVFLAQGAALSGASLLVAIALALAYFVLHFGKMALIVELEKRGGDARQFAAGERLVTTGFYAWSRNPVYVVSLIESFLWSILLVFLSHGQEAALIGYALAPALLYGHYWGMDRLIVPNEEAALKNGHPDEFAAYCASVRRWFGRKA